MTNLVPKRFAEAVDAYEPDPVDADAPYAVTGATWLRRLPRLLDDLVAGWDLAVDGPTCWGHCAVVLPVTGPEGPAALKVSWPHLEARAEHLALRHWDGHGAVRLVRADPARFALLLERLDATTDLMDVPIDKACGVIGDLLAQLSSPAISRTPTLSAYAARHAVGADHALDGGLPRRFVGQARHLAADLGADPALDSCLIHSDLHYTNVLSAQRQSWLAIDPKPMAGDRAFEVAPALWNRSEELGSGSSVRSLLRRRVEIICERSGIDEARAKAWTIVREVDNATGLASGSDRVGLAVAIIKAMND